MEDKAAKTTTEEPFRIRKANEYFKEIKRAKPPEMLFDEFWREGELALVFGSSGSGKSILAVQIAEAIARGRAIDGFRMPTRGRRVLYADMEMSGEQFAMRNSTVAANLDCLKNHKFSENFYREAPPDVNELMSWLRKAVKETNARVVVIDSLAAVRKTQDGVRETLGLMRELRRLKDELDISILVATDCAESRRGRTLTEADMGRNRVLCSVADSVFAICRHRTHFDHRFIVQTRSRNAPVAWTIENAPLCGIVKRDTGLLAFQFDDRFVANLDQDELELICNLKVARDEGGESFRSAAELFEISRSRAERLYKKWSPAIETKYRTLVAAMPVDKDDKSEPPAVAGGLTQADDDAKVLNGNLQPPATAGGSDSLDELDEFDEAGIERPPWLEHERSEQQITNSEQRNTNGELRVENGEQDNGEGKVENGRCVADPDEISRDPESILHSQFSTLQSEGPRSVYDLKRGIDAYGREIFIESEFEHDGSPKVFYQFDSKGFLIKKVRDLWGATGTRLGPGPYF